MSRLGGQAYQYWQTSKIPTKKFQRSLPRLKIPKLDRTCQRYMAALQPVFSHDSRIDKAVEVTNRFRDGPGKDLQAALLNYDTTVKHSSYINEFWSDMYLSSRLPLPLNYNPFMVYRDATTDNLNDQLVRSTNLLVSAMRFKRSLEENILEPEVFHLNSKKISPYYNKVMELVPESIATYASFMFKAFPLDMSQYENLFNSTRLPRPERDEILKSDPSSNRHVLVLSRGRFYIFDALNEDGRIKKPDEIYANLVYIVNDKTTDNHDHSISELTTSNRDIWAKEREHLIAISESNKNNLDMIDSAILVLSLDETSEKKLEIDVAHAFLHGRNEHGPLNRWFDKSLSLIVTKDGHAAVNFEHSWGDGVAILRFFNDTFNDSMKNPQLVEPILPDATYVNVKRLEFELDSRLERSIEKCRFDHLEKTANLDLGAVKYDKFDRNHFKKNKLSPDSMSQLAFQLAFKKLYQDTAVTYESCSTAAFRGGRTETVRPCTNETNAASKALIESRFTSKGSNKTKGEFLSLLRDCSQKHYQLCKEASMGQGFDRHLFALKEIALRTGTKLPELFTDPLYLQNQHYTLSTSTLYGECFAGGGFAPVVADGFGLGYGYVDATFGVLVASYKDKRNNNQFVQALIESLDDIRKITED